jgi:hypothetical protein
MKRYTVGVAGYAGAGKDTAVEHMVASHGFSRVAFADPLREFAAAVNPIVGFDAEAGPIRYNDALASVGYTQAKIDFPEVRNLLQKIGTEGARETFWDSFWVDLALRRSEELGGRVAFSDCRFPNEAQQCDFVVWVDRPGVKPVNAHPSDNSMNDWDFDYVLLNDSDFNDLYEQIDAMVGVLDARAS